MIGTRSIAAVAVALIVAACAPRGDREMRVVGGPPVGDYLVIDPSDPPARVTMEFHGYVYVLRRNGRELERGSYQSTGNRMSLVPEGGPCAGQVSYWTWLWRDEQLTLRFFDGRCAAIAGTRTRLLLVRR
ncbi:MAG TPA: hypothetical protein VK837_07025 [Longimicrobiales bacterium]|nr:hypothetical protein [Longimicrobiales bacterium]